MATTTDDTDHLGRDLLTPDSDARDYMGRAIGEGDLDFLGRATVETGGEPEPGEGIEFGGELGTNDSDGTDATTVTVTTTDTVPAGGFCVFAVSGYSGSTVTGSGGGLTWTTDSKHAKPGDSNAYVSIVSAQAPAGLASGTVITFTYTSGTFSRAVWGAWWTGIATTSPKDAQAGDNSATASAWASASITTTNPDDLIIGVAIADFTSAPNAPATDYLEAVDFAATGISASCPMVYRIVSATGSWTPGGSFAPSGPTWLAGGIAYKAA